jgi:hypothetical protein
MFDTGIPPGIFINKKPDWRRAIPTRRQTRVDGSALPRWA